MSRPKRKRRFLTALSACAISTPALLAAQTDEQRWLFQSWKPVAELDSVPAFVPLPVSARQLPDNISARVQPLDHSQDCLTPGMPEVMETSAAIEFIHTHDRIHIRFYEWNIERTVYLQPGNGPPVQDPSPLGVSFGRWEESTLAVFTLYISNPASDGDAPPTSRDLTTLERYIPHTSGEQLTWELTVTDQANSEGPVTRKVTLARTEFGQSGDFGSAEARDANCITG